MDADVGLIEQMQIDGKSREEIIATVMSYFGLSKEEAAFMVAVALGEIDGDVIELDAHGNVV
jgi:hypothetical protein